MGRVGDRDVVGQEDLSRSGREVLALVLEQPFDLVMLDILMPEMSGMEVLHKLKDDAALRHIPVVMISALDEMDSIIRAIELGAEDYLPKPCEPAILKARVGACLEKKRLRDRDVEQRRQIEIETALSDQAWPALVDRSQLTSALVNLAINARDAMPDGGTLLFRTGNFTRHAGDAEVVDLGAGDYVAIEVIDSGAGIPPAIRDRIFEPFFTTKSGPDETGKGGTGLGLSACRKIVEAHHGRIRVESTVGKGTQFTIKLPIARQPAEPIVHRS